MLSARTLRARMKRNVESYFIAAVALRIYHAIHNDDALWETVYQGIWGEAIERLADAGTALGEAVYKHAILKDREYDAYLTEDKFVAAYVRFLKEHERIPYHYDELPELARKSIVFIDPDKQ